VTTGTAARLGRPELAPLVDELVRRLSEAAAPATVALRGLPESARRTLADLLGTDRVPPASARVRVDRMVTALGLASVQELRRAVEELRGPLPDRQAERAKDRADRQALWEWLALSAGAIPLAPAGERMAVWAEAQRRRGARGGVAAHRRRLERALAVLSVLPADGRPLSSLAAAHAGDPHALDHGTLLAAIVLEGIAAAVDAQRPTNAEETRRLWESVGVAPDPHSSTVLALGLPLDPATSLGRWLGEAAAVSEPVVLSLSHLRHWPLGALPASTPVFVVENPAVVVEVAASDWAQPDRARPVIVCSSGRPNVAVVTLLRQLSAAGAPVLQHADFDPAGLAITGWLAERAASTPWRMGAREYLSAVSSAHDREGIKGSVPPTPWDPELQTAMQRHEAAVFEEDLRTDLLDAIRETVVDGGGVLGRDPARCARPEATP
jgi:uncharacterized protein (TIGR02679 family)